MEEMVQRARVAMEEISGLRSTTLEKIRGESSFCTRRMALRSITSSINLLSLRIV